MTTRIWQWNNGRCTSCGGRGPVGNCCNGIDHDEPIGELGTDDLPSGFKIGLRTCTNALGAEMFLKEGQFVSFAEEAQSMTLLIPDRDRENQTDFIWCVPVERVKWNRWYELSKKSKTVVPPEHGGVRYVNRMEGKKVRTILMMPNEEQSDDDAVHSCAFLRMVKELTCRMYIVRSTDDPLTGARLINKVAGCDASLVEDVEIADGQEESEA